MARLDKPDSHLTTVKWRFPSVHPEGRKFTLIAAFVDLGRLTALVSRFLRLAAGRPDDLGRGLLPRSDPHHAAGSRADRRAGRRAGDDDQPACRRRSSWRARAGCRRRIHPRLDFHERVRRPHQSLADRRHGRAASPMSRASSSTPTSTRRARTMSASISWSSATTG